MTFDERANVYRVTWQASGNVMTAAVPRSSGSAQTAVLVSSAASEPDVSYNPGLGQTLFVWSGNIDKSIHGCSMTGGNLNAIFQVSNGIIVAAEDHYPSVVPDGTRSGWVAAWQRNPLAHAIISIVPQGATGNLSGGNRSVSADGATGEFTPAAAMRGDGAALVALRRTAPASEVAVFTVDDLGGLANADWHYGYDALGRLTTACSQWDGAICRGHQWTYTYDGAGNPTRFDRWNPSTGQVETISYRYNGANQVECIDVDANGACNGTEFWVYDAHGNLTFDRAARYVYDAANHLATACDSGDGLACDVLGNETTYQYNGDGARVAQSVRKGILPATVTTYTLDVNLSLTQVLSETTNGQTTRYLHGLDLIAQSDGTSTEYLAYDGLGSVRQIVDGSGTVLTSQTFDPYGTPYSADAQAAGSFGFTGEQTDENGLVYLRARYYNPAQGRFMQVDPSRMERNGYEYARCNPLTHTDPSGHCASLFKIIGGFFQGFTELGSPGSSGDEPFRRAFEAAAAECEDNIDFYSNSLFNPHASYAPVFGSAYNQAFWKMTVGPTLEDVMVGTGEVAEANARWVGAGRYGQWLGTTAPGRWLGWGADTSSYYNYSTERYVQDFSTLFWSYHAIGTLVGGVALSAAGNQAASSVASQSSSLAYDQLTLESSVLLDSGEAIPVEGVVTAMKYGRWLLSQEEAAAGSGNLIGSGGQLTRNACGMACGQRALAKEGIYVFQSNLAGGFWGGLTPEALARNLNQYSTGWTGGFYYPTAEELTGLVSRGTVIARLGGIRGHFVMIESISEGVVEYWDPAGGVIETKLMDELIINDEIFYQQVKEYLISGLVWR